MRALLQTGAALMLAFGLASHAAANTADALRDQALASNDAYAILESLTTEIGARPAGSEADARAVAWAVAKFKALGYDKVTTEPVRFTGWRRGAESAEVTSPSPQRLAVTALGGSVGTSGDLRADVVAFSSLQALQAAAPEQVRGKIVFLSQHMERRHDGGGYAEVLPMRSNGASIAARKGASALLIRSLATTDDRLPHTGSVIYDGGAVIPAAAISGPDADLLEHLLLRGRPVQLRLNLQSATFADQLSYNVIGEISGRELPQETVMISAHLDSWDLGTGAVDDGFGVALTMAAGALIKRQPQAPRRTVRVVLFANEENGFDGARTYAARAPSELACHRLVLESDWGAGRIYALRHPLADAALTTQMMQALAPLGIALDGQAGTPGPDARFLAERKVPWLQLAQDASALFDHHHSANDTLDKVDPAALAQNTAAYAVVAWSAANAPATPCQP
jgi:Zn-dependent M28 family amino/carboxypeptidase